MTGLAETHGDDAPVVVAGSGLRALGAVAARAHRRPERCRTEVAEFVSGLTALDRAWLVTHSAIVNPGTRRALWVFASRVGRKALLTALVRARWQRRAAVAYRAVAVGRLEPVELAELERLPVWAGADLVVAVNHRQRHVGSLRALWSTVLANPIPSGRWGAGATEFRRVVRHRRRTTEAGPGDGRWSDDRARLLAAQSTRSVDVVIPVHDAPAAVRRCLASVVAHRDPARHRIIVVDDGSGSETAAVLQRFADEHPETVLIRHDAARGFSGAVNAGLRTSTAEMVVVLNSDTEVSADWIAKLADWMYRPAGVGIVGPLSNAASHQSLPRTAPTDAERAARQTVFNELPEGLSIADVNTRLEQHARWQPVRTSMVNGFCFAVRREVIREVGLLDEVNFPRGYGEEFDYCFRIADAGWSAVLATNTYVWHSRTQSFSADERARLGPLGIATVERLYGARRRELASRILSRNPELARLRGLFETGDNP